jgi:hypothetical protein
MIAYNGRFCGFKQYLPAKPITHGIKVFVMCCAATHYILNWEVYVDTGVNPATLHHGEGGVVEDDERAEGVDNDVDDQALPEHAPQELHPGLDVDDDFVGTTPARQSTVAGEDLAARRAARLLAKKTGLGAGATVINRLTAGLNNMHYTLAC